MVVVSNTSPSTMATDPPTNNNRILLQLMLSYAVIVVVIVVYAQKATIVLVPSHCCLAGMHVWEAFLLLQNHTYSRSVGSKVETHVSLWMKRPCARPPYYSQ
jgi:hypothetical protein